VCIEEGIAAPAALIDLRSVIGGDALTWSEDGLRIGAAARVRDIADDARVREHFPVLSAACDVVGSPALRNMGTIGGNLCQRPRCWYYRRAIPCLKNGGSGCPAHTGENQYLAILDGGPCYIVHPSDPAVALTALDATVEITSASGTRTLPISEFYVLPRARLDHETVLRGGEIVSAVVIGRAAGGGQQL